MVQLFLKRTSGTDTAWHEVIVQANQKIKLTSENPYIKESEQYTLEVSIPMDILQNRLFFQNMQRMNVRKRKELLDCRLAVNGKNVIFGTAKLRSVTEDTVKVQLVAGRSEINLKSEEQKLYIDEMELGTIVWRIVNWNILSGIEREFAFLDYEGKLTHPGVLSTFGLPCNSDVDNGGPEDYWLHWPFTLHPIWNETKNCACNLYPVGNAKFSDTYYTAIQPNLIYVIRAIFHCLGYTVKANCLHRNPWLFLHIASARRTITIAYALPHWTVKEFLQQLEQTFCCTFLIDQESRSVDIVFKKEGISESSMTELKTVDEYSVEFNDDSEADIFSGNVSFKMSDSDANKYACLSDEIRESIPQKEYATQEEMTTAFAEMSEQEKEKYIFSCAIGGDWFSLNGVLKRVDWFKPLVRSENDDAVELKICPATIIENNEDYNIGSFLLYNQPWPFGPQKLLSAEDPCEITRQHNWVSINNEEWIALGGGEIFDPSVDSAHGLIENGGKGNPYNTDRMELFFNDEISKPGVDPNKGDVWMEPFNDGTVQEGHRGWSLSFYNEGNLTLYLGQHHFDKRLYNPNTKYCFKFFSKEIPNPRTLFHANNKMYVCEKIETDIDENGISQLMTGYFYELES